MYPLPGTKTILMIPTELIVCRVDIEDHPTSGYYYVASADDAEPQTEPEKTPYRAIEAFAVFYKSATEKELDQLTKKILLHVGYVSLHGDF